MDPVLGRRSIRKYTDEDVSGQDVRYLLEAAMAALRILATPDLAQQG